MYFVTVITEIPNWNPETALEQFREGHPGARKAVIEIGRIGEIREEDLLLDSPINPVVYEFRCENSVAAFLLYEYMWRNANWVDRSGYTYDERERKRKLYHVFGGRLPVVPQ